VDVESPVWARVLSLALKACARLGKGQRAVSIYEQSQEPPAKLPAVPAAVLALKACFRAGRHPDAARFARVLLQAGPSASLDLPTLNMWWVWESWVLRCEWAGDCHNHVGAWLGTCSISSLSKSNCSGEALAMLEASRSMGVTPDAVSYGAAIEGLAIEADWEGALGLLRRMQAEGLEANVVIFNMVINAACRAGRLDVAMGLYTRLSTTASPEPHRLHPLITTASRLGDREVMRRLLKDLRESGGVLAPAVYEACLCNLARLGEDELATEVIEVMMANGLPPTATVYQAIISACDKAEAYERVLHW
jgi:pentatricopeptide repeat protein